jgi:hypothetical protein
MKYHMFGVNRLMNMVLIPVVIFMIIIIVLFIAGCQANTSSLPAIPPTVTPIPETETNSVWPSSLDTWVSVGKDFFTGLAIIVGGWWSYNKFIRQREKFPRSKITHNIVHKPLTNDKVLLHITVNISNAGEVLLRLKSAETRIQQVLPLSGKTGKLVKSGNDPVLRGQLEIEWPLLGSRKALPSKGLQIEPGESDWLSYDFIIDKKVQLVRVYSYLKNVSQRDRDIGWSLETLYDLRVKSGSKKVI